MGTESERPCPPHLEVIHGVDLVDGVDRHLYRVDRHVRPEGPLECARVGGACAGEDRYLAGYLAALSDYAWWKDGTQFVGCGRLTLAQAIDKHRERLRRS